MTEFRTLVDMLEQSTRRYADHPCLGTKSDGEWSFIRYVDLAARVGRLRGGLRSLGIGPGDRVAVISDNREEWAVLSGATYGVGAQLVPMYQAQLPKEWAFILRDSGAKAVFTASRGISLILRSLSAELPELEHVVCFEGGSTDADSYARLLQHEVSPAFEPQSTDVAAFIYTSGTTGMPKGVLLTHDNIISNINAVHRVFTFEPHDRSLSFLPWAHSFGQVGELYMLLSMGCSIAINDDLPKLVDNMLEVHPTVLFAVPRVFNKLYAAVHHQMEDKPAFVRHLFEDGVELATEKAHGEHLDLGERAELLLSDKLVFARVRQKFGGKLKYAISASAALNPKVAEFVQALGITVFEGYGLTETSPVVSVNRPGFNKIGSVGQPIPGVRVVIDRSVTGGDDDGEIVVYGPNVMRGYHGRAAETARVLMPDGGFRTGDLGYLDEDGFLYITGRIKEQYKLENGKYVMPAPLEEALKLSPAITNVMIYGDNRPFNVAVVVPDVQALEHLAKEARLTLGPDLSVCPATQRLLEQEIERYSADFRSFERPRALCVVKEDFSPENGLLTPTLKLKRQLAVQRFMPQIEALYTNVV
jgi:long-chain acyl-CoA synthetase